MALKGIRVIEMAGLAPAPFCGMLLADFGASVIRVDKKPKSGPMNNIGLPDTLGRGKKSLALDIKSKEGQGIVKKLISTADVLIEPFRPGVMEKLKLGPNDFNAVNPKLIYARISGYGQTGPYSMLAGHDINYVATSGVLSFLGRSGEKPTPPVNLIADFAGGGLLCAYAILAAIFERGISGKGQVIDLSLAEGASYVSSFLFTTQKCPYWGNPRGQNLLDSGSHFYDTYETKDGLWMSVGALEPQFYSLLLKGLGLSEDPKFQVQFGDFESRKIIIVDKFKEKTQAEWVKIFGKTDACVMPVEHWSTVNKSPQNDFRNSFLSDEDGNIEPAPAPKLSRTPAFATSGPGPHPGQHSFEILQELGYSKEEVQKLSDSGVTEQSEDMPKIPSKL